MSSQHHAAVARRKLGDITELRQPKHIQLTPLFACIKGVQLGYKNQNVSGHRFKLNANKNRKIAQFSRNDPPRNICRRTPINNRNRV